MLTVSSVWIGERLSRMERLCVRSHLRHGHGFRLYAYGEPEGVPAGVELVDAASVLPASRIFRAENGALGDFANYFKYRVLREHGGCWTEMDEVCLRPWSEELGYFISSEWNTDGSDGIDQAAIRIEPGHRLMAALVDGCEQYLARADAPMPWGTFGVKAFAQAVVDHRLGHRVVSPDAFCSLPWWKASDLLEPGGIPDGAYGLQLWNEAWRRADWNKDAPPPGSLYARLCEEYDP